MTIYKNDSALNAGCGVYYTVNTLKYRLKEDISYDSGKTTIAVYMARERLSIDDLMIFGNRYDYMEVCDFYFINNSQATFKMRNNTNASVNPIVYRAGTSDIHIFV